MKGSEKSRQSLLDDMMFDKDLFLLLCEKYDVELSETATSPMIKEGEQAHAIIVDDVNRACTMSDILCIFK